MCSNGVGYDKEKKEGVVWNRMILQVEKKILSKNPLRSQKYVSQYFSEIVIFNKHLPESMQVICRLIFSSMLCSLNFSWCPTVLLD